MAGPGTRPAPVPAPGWVRGASAALWAASLLGVAATAWLDHLLRQAGFFELTSLHPLAIPDLTAMLSAVTVGAVLTTRRPRHPVGWLLLGLGLSLSLKNVLFAYTRYGLVAQPGSLPGAGHLAGFNNSLTLLWLSCVCFVLLLTPTGSLPSPRWRWPARAAGAAPAGRRLGRRRAAALSLIAAALSLIGRFRRAPHPAERQQLRWLALGAGLAAVALVTALVCLFVLDQFDLFVVVLGVFAAILPLATGASILRYRLYDLDRIVSRTVSYALLTLVLGFGYAVVVVGLGQLFGGGSSLVVAAATLVLAAAFQPARRRIQDAVDRRFNRRRYDAAQTIAAFSTRLRRQIDLDNLSGEVLAVVDQTMQPTHPSLWLRPSGR